AEDDRARAAEGLGTLEVEPAVVRVAGVAQIDGAVEGQPVGDGDIGPVEGTFVAGGQVERAVEGDTRERPAIAAVVSADQGGAVARGHSAAVDRAGIEEVGETGVIQRQRGASVVQRAREVDGAAAAAEAEAGVGGQIRGARDVEGPGVDADGPRVGPGAGEADGSAAAGGDRASTGPGVVEIQRATVAGLEGPGVGPVGAVDGEFAAAHIVGDGALIDQG